MIEDALPPWEPYRSSWEKLPARVRWFAYMLAVAVLVAGVTILAVKAPDGDGHDHVRQDIKACIAQGGDPVFTQSRFGTPIEFLGCRQ